MSQSADQTPCGSCNCETLLARLNRVDMRIGSEYSEINNRVNWLLVFQGFLFTAYVSVDHAPDSDLPAVISLLAWVIPLTGLVTAAIVKIAVDAGVDFLESTLKPARKALEERASSVGLEKLGADVDTHFHKHGVFPALKLPYLLMGIWVLVLLFQMFFLLVSLLSLLYIL